MECLPAADKSANAIRQTSCSLKELEGGLIPRESQEPWAGPTQRPPKHAGISIHPKTLVGVPPQEPDFPLPGRSCLHIIPKPKGHIFESVRLFACKMQNTHPSRTLVIWPTMLQGRHDCRKQRRNTDVFLCLSGCWPQVHPAPQPPQ